MSSTRLLEVIDGGARVSPLNAPAVVGLESVATMGELPPAANRPDGWHIYVQEIGGDVIRATNGGDPAWLVVSAASPRPEVIFIVPGDGTLQAALVAAALLSPTAETPVMILAAPGVYGTFADDVVMIDNVIIKPLGGGLGNGMASGDTGDGAPVQPMTIRCANLLWTAGSSGAFAQLEGALVEFDDVGATFDLSGVDGATLQTKGCYFDGVSTATGNTNGSSRWIDDGSFFEDDVELYNMNWYFNASALYEALDAEVGFSGVFVEGRIIDCSIWNLFTNTSGGADGTIDILARGGEIVDEIFLDTNTTLDAPTTTLPSFDVSGDGSGGASMNRSQSFAISTTGGGATDTFNYVDSFGDDLPFPSSGPSPIPQLLAIADDGAGGTMPTLSAMGNGSFDVTDWDAARSFMVLVSRPAFSQD